MATTTTDANGHYSFIAYPGHYNIQVATQPGYSFIPTGDSDMSDSGWSGFHELATNQTLTLDAGLGIPPAPVPPVTITKYYHFNGQPVAMRKVVDGQPDALYYLHADHLGSTVLVTDRSGNTFETQQYYAYGRPRGGGTLPTDHTFTGQKVDGTGLMYYRARYYDPVIGQFVSPDTLVPDATSVLDYNRYMMVRGNPLKYTDSSGHCIDGISTWFCIGAILIGAAFLLQGDDPGYQPTQADINSQRLGGSLIIAGGTGLFASELLGASTSAACADGDCTNEVNTIASVEPSVSNAAQAAEKLVQRGLTSPQSSQLVDQIATGSINNSFVSNGTTSLGSFPEYINQAGTRMTYFNLPSQAWDTLAKAGNEYVWAVNKRFLDYAVMNNQRFSVTIGAGKTPGEYLQREISYLINEMGYVWQNGVANGTLIPGK